MRVGFGLSLVGAGGMQLGFENETKKKRWARERINLYVRRHTSALLFSRVPLFCVRVNVVATLRFERQPSLVSVIREGVSAVLAYNIIMQPAIQSYLISIIQRRVCEWAVKSNMAESRGHDIESHTFDPE